MVVEPSRIARACGIKGTFDISGQLGLCEFAGRVHRAATTLFARVAIRADEPPRVLPPRDGVHLKTRFRSAIGVESLTIPRTGEKSHVANWRR